MEARLQSSLQPVDRAVVIGYGPTGRTVSRLLRDRSLVEKLRATENAEALYALLTEPVQAQSAA